MGDSTFLFSHVLYVCKAILLSYRLQTAVDIPDGGPEIVRIPSRGRSSSIVSGVERLGNLIAAVVVEQIVQQGHLQVVLPVAKGSIVRSYIHTYTTYINKNLFVIICESNSCA